MPGPLGTIAGMIVIDAQQALASYAAVRAANAQTVSSLGAASSAFAKVGVTAIAAGAPLVALFGAAVDAAAKFEKKIDYFGAVTNATQADMDLIAKKAISMSQTTVFSADQMADAFVEFGKAGISTADILGGVADATANLAQAADISITDASNIIVSTMKTFGIAASGTGHIADLLAGAANASIIDVSDLAASLKYVGGIASATGVPLESVTTAIALLGQAGIKGSQAGTSLRQILISITGPTKAASAEMLKLGITTKNGTSLFIDQAGHVKPLADIFQILQDKTAGLTDAQRLAATKVLFNSRALAAANILLKDGAAGFDQMNTAIEGVSAADVAAKRLDNLSGDLTRLKNSIQTALIQAGTPFQDFLREMVQNLTKAVQWFGNLSPSTQKWILTVIAATGALLTIIGAVSLLVAGILKIIQVFLLLRDAFLLIMVVVRAFQALWIILDLIMNANPFSVIVIAILAIVAAVVYCYFHFKTFRDIVDGVWTWVKKASVEFWHAMVDAFNYVKNAAVDIWHDIDNWIVHPVVTAFNAVVAAMKAAYGFISDVISTIVDVVETVGDAFVDVYNAVSTAIGDTVSFLAYHWKLIVAIILGPIGLVIDAVVTHWTAIKNFIMVIVNFLVKFFEVEFQIMYVIISTVFNAVKTVVTDVWNFIFNLIKLQVEAIKLVITTAWNVIKEVATTVWEGIKLYFQTWWTIITTVFTTAINAIEAVLTAIWGAIGGTVTSVWNGIIAFITGAWNTIYGVVSTGVQKVWNVISSIFSTVAGIATKALSAFATAVGNGFSTVYGIASNAVSTILGIIFDIVGDMISAGTNLVHALWTGIQGAVSWLYDKLKKWASDIISNVLGFFGIHSPSKVFMDMGHQLSMGMAQGIQNSTKYAVTAARQMAAAVSDAASVQASYSGIASGSLPNSLTAINSGSSTYTVSTSAMNHGTDRDNTNSKPTNQPTPIVHVYIGDKELTDMVNVVVDNTFAPMTQMAKAGGL